MLQFIAEFNPFWNTDKVQNTTDIISNITHSQNSMSGNCGWILPDVNRLCLTSDECFSLRWPWPSMIGFLPILLISFLYIMLCRSRFLCLLVYRRVTWPQMNLSEQVSILACVQECHLTTDEPIRVKNMNIHHSLFIQPLFLWTMPFFQNVEWSYEHTHSCSCPFLHILSWSMRFNIS